MGTNQDRAMWMIDHGKTNIQVLFAEVMVMMTTLYLRTYETKKATRHCFGTVVDARTVSPMGRNTALVVRIGYGLWILCRARLRSSASSSGRTLRTRLRDL